MRNFILPVVLFASMSAHALEFGVNASRDAGNSDRVGNGFTLGQKFDKVGVTAGFDRYTSAVDKYSVVGSYDVAKFGPATIVVKAGGVYLKQAVGTDGYAAVAGAGAVLPFTKQMALTVDYRYQKGQTQLNTFDGGTVTGGLKYSF